MSRRRYCAHPESPSCEVGPHPKRPVPHKVPCPTACADGSPMALHRALSAYAVARPADVSSMQKEIMAHGSIEVGFQVFSDFMSYHNGTYRRTAGAQLKGGHAVKLIGWGVDEKGVDYWVATNSWSPLWGGLHGFFHIERGTNQCGVETTPAAGLPDIAVS
jgi:cathepsin B